MGKKGKSSFFGTPSSIRDFLTLCELGTWDLAYSTSCNQYLMIFNYSWLKVKSKLFSRAKNVKKWKSLLFGAPSSTSYFSDPI